MDKLFIVTSRGENAPSSIFSLTRSGAPRSLGENYWVEGKQSGGTPPGDAEVEDFYTLNGGDGLGDTHSSIGDEICPQTETGAGFVKY
jgi:hypothetical protein